MSNSTIVKHRLAAFKRQNGRCYYCGSFMWRENKEIFAIKYAISIQEAAKYKCTAEHLVARCDGGDNSNNNIVAACHFCNGVRHRRKIAPDPAKYREHIQRRLSKGKWHPKSQHHLVSLHA
jgi:5-methylcytosine-specific restriction endonuclease McrA